MRLLFLNHNVAGSGTYQRAVNIAAEAARRGYEPTLVTTSRTRALRSTVREERGVRVVEAPDLLRGPARNGWDVWNTLWRVRWLDPDAYDVVHAFDCRPVVIGPALVARRLGGVPLWLDWADWWGRGGAIGERSGWAVRTLFGPIETWFEEAFRAGATANTVISDALRDRCIALGADPAAVLTMPNGCRPPVPSGPGERRAARAALGIESVMPVIVHAGAMLPADATFLFDAFRRVRAALPGACLVLLGNPSGTPAPDRDPLGVVRTGFVAEPDLWRWLAAADAGVIVLRDTIASRARWPGKLNDYLTAGLPVVMTAVGAAASYVERHGAGRTTSPDPAAFAEALVSFLVDEAGRREASAAAAALAGGPLAWTHVTEDLFARYGAVPAGSAAAGAGPSMAGVS